MVLFNRSFRVMACIFGWKLKPRIAHHLIPHSILFGIDLKSSNAKCIQGDITTENSLKMRATTWNSNGRNENDCFVVRTMSNTRFIGHHCCGCLCNNHFIDIFDLWIQMVFGNSGDTVDLPYNHCVCARIDDDTSYLVHLLPHTFNIVYYKYISFLSCALSDILTQQFSTVVWNALKMFRKS